MQIQISAGRGPAECEYAVGRLMKEIVKDGKAEVVSAVKGGERGCYKSAVLSGGDDLLEWVGTVQWICASPFRPRHRRKNWFIDVSVCGGPETEPFDPGLIRFEVFRSGGHGGQHVNRTESGVRAVYEKTGDTAISTDERSQHQNKRMALERLRQTVETRNGRAEAACAEKTWKLHEQLTRGNAEAVFEGMEFVRKR